MDFAFKCCSIDEQDEENEQTLLHLAVVEGKTDYVRILRHHFNAGMSVCKAQSLEDTRQSRILPLSRAGQ